MTRDELIRQTPESIAWLREKMLAMHEEPGHKSDRELIEAARLATDPTSLSKFRTGHRKLTRDDHDKLVRFFFDRGYGAPEQRLLDQIMSVPNYFSHALNAYVGVETGVREKLGPRAEGVYRSWRPSSHWPGHYVCGMMTFKRGDANVVLVTEVQRFGGGTHVRMRIEEYEGYVIRKHGKFCLVTRDKGNGALRLTILAGCREGNTLVSFSGAVLGTYDNRIYAAPVYIERCDAEDVEHLKTSIDILSREQVPELVLQKLGAVQIQDSLIQF